MSSSIAKRFYQYWCNVCVKDTINSKLRKIINESQRYDYGNNGMRNKLASLKGSGKSKSNDKKNDKDNDKDNWVLCDLCNIWRLLPDTYDMKALLKKGNIWICNDTENFVCNIE